MDQHSPVVADPGDAYPDLTEPVILDSNTRSWVPVPQYNRSYRHLARRTADPPWSTGLALLSGGGGMPGHLHAHGSEVYVLSGELNDEHGEYRWGTYVRYPPGFRHASFNFEGCRYLYHNGQVGRPAGEFLVVDGEALAWVATGQPGVEQKVLYADPAGRERVGLQRWAAGTRVVPGAVPGGAEIFLLAGELTVGHAVLGTGAWLRFPADQMPTLEAALPCTLFLKRGHLP